VHVSNTSLVHMALPSTRDFRFPDTITVHGRLAACLAMWSSDPDFQVYKLWQNVWPTQKDFSSTMPLYYPKELQDLLPHAATTLLTNQCNNLERDWNSIRTHIPSIPKDLFTYAWLIVNTRTFYWEYPDLPHSHARLPKKRNKLTSGKSSCSVRRMGSSGECIRTSELLLWLEGLANTPEIPKQYPLFRKSLLIASRPKMTATLCAHSWTTSTTLIRDAILRPTAKAIASPQIASTRLARKSS
jgi:hypothetical protein